MNQRGGLVMDFRTPQHPSIGTNNWGGASPLLARNLPKESLDAMYLKLNTVRTHDEIFPFEGDVVTLPAPPAAKYIPPPTPSHNKLFSWFHQEKTLGSNDQKKKRRGLPRLDPRTKWPQGWR